MTIVDYYNKFFNYAPDIFAFLEEEYSFKIKEKEVSESGFYALLVYKWNDFEISIIFNAREERTNIKLESKSKNLDKSIKDFMIENGNKNADFRIFSLNLFEYDEELIKENFKKQGEFLQALALSQINNN